MAEQNAQNQVIAQISYTKISYRRSRIKRSLNYNMSFASYAIYMRINYI